MLQVALARYREIAAAGGWVRIPEEARFQRGTSDSAVLVLRSRLRAEGYPLDFPSPGAERYDSVVERVVRRFQELHGLPADGVVGRATIKALNVTAAGRAAQIAANLVRERTGTALTTGRSIVVNVPAFTLEVVEDGRSRFTLRTIVGRSDWPTPLFHSIVTELVFGPSWVIPHSITVREILPEVRKDPGYFKRTGTRVFQQGKGEVDPTAVDWAGTSPRGFPYRFVQDPGPLNPLGGVKLVFRSAYQVFAHDTPARSLFARSRRTLSHGCIRVEHIERLLGYLLPAWPADSIQEMMRQGRDTRIALADSVPIHVVYRTAWLDPDGLVAFRDDVYRLDQRAGQKGLHGILTLPYQR
jgi:murein L,D-transpeptidase YcbB/YkuD